MGVGFASYITFLHQCQLTGHDLAKSGRKRHITKFDEKIIAVRKKCVQNNQCSHFHPATPYCLSLHDHEIRHPPWFALLPLLLLLLLLLLNWPASSDSKSLFTYDCIALWHKTAEDIRALPHAQQNHQSWSYWLYDSTRPRWLWYKIITNNGSQIRPWY